jgi:hypothetical protein
MIDGKLLFGNLDELKAKSKPLHELVNSEMFTIDDVVATVQPTLITPRNEMRIGGRSGTYNGGFTSKTVLNVTPEDKSLPIRTLVFSGFSAARVGDIVCAQIPRYTQNGGDENFRPMNGPRSLQIFYTDREYNSMENAIELGILDSNGDLLRTERSFDYNSFQKNKF